MSKKRPHLIMGQLVQGTPTQGYTIEVKYYDSTNNNAFIPDAQLMLSELQSDLDRFNRVIKARSRKYETTAG